MVAKNGSGPATKVSRAGGVVQVGERDSTSNTHPSLRCPACGGDLTWRNEVSS
jgi:hypothetical protein